MATSYAICVPFDFLFRYFAAWTVHSWDIVVYMDGHSKHTYGCETFCEKDFAFQTEAGYGATFLAVSNSRRRGKKNLGYSHRVKSSGRLFVPSDTLGAVQISFLQIYKQNHTNASKEFSISESRIPRPTYFVEKNLVKSL